MSSWSPITQSLSYIRRSCVLYSALFYSKVCQGTSHVLYSALFYLNASCVTRTSISAMAFNGHFLKISCPANLAFPLFLLLDCCSMFSARQCSKSESMAIPLVFAWFYNYPNVCVCSAN